MAGILVYVHHDEGELSPQSLGVLAKAATLGERGLPTDRHTAHSMT